MYKTGEKPGKGEYYCTKCGQNVTLDDNTDTLPPCPRCDNTTLIKNKKEKTMNSKIYCLPMPDAKDNTQAMCTHFQWVDKVDDLITGKFTIKDKMLMINYDNGIGGIKKFKEWLAKQNEKGTPMQVQYILDKPKIISLNKE